MKLFFISLDHGEDVCIYLNITESFYVNIVDLSHRVIGMHARNADPKFPFGFL